MFLTSNATVQYTTYVQTYDYSNIFANGYMFTTDDRFTLCPIKANWYKPEIQYSLFFCTFIFNNPLILFYVPKILDAEIPKFLKTKFHLPIYSWCLSFITPLIITLIVGGYYDLKGLFWSLYMYCFLMTFSTLLLIKSFNNNKVGFSNEPVENKITDMFNKFILNVNFFEETDSFNKFLVAVQMAIVYLGLPFAWSILLSSDYQNILNVNRTILSICFIIFLVIYVGTVGFYEFNNVKELL